mmetsp:Transcript_23308/g.60757  ORF Transcript_23308/g.60757 Transcript_23308/m.60757 type:complete len:378 (-) Transcript_23308:246-1379(-)
MSYHVTVSVAVSAASAFDSDARSTATRSKSPSPSTSAPTTAIAPGTSSTTAPAVQVRVPSTTNVWYHTTAPSSKLALRTSGWPSSSTSPTNISLTLLASVAMWWVAQEASPIEVPRFSYQVTFPSPVVAQTTSTSPSPSKSPAHVSTGTWTPSTIGSYDQSSRSVRMSSTWNHTMYWSSTAATTTSLTLSPSTSAVAAPVAPRVGKRSDTTRSVQPVALPSFSYHATMVARLHRDAVSTSRSPSPSTSPTETSHVPSSMSARITRARHVSPDPSAFSYHARITFSSPPATKSTSPSPSRSAGHSVVNTLSNVRSSPGSVAVAATLLTHVPVAPPAPTRCTVTSGSDPTMISGCPSPSRSAAASASGFSSPSSTTYLQ